MINELTIQTSDTLLAEDLKTANIQNLKVTERRIVCKTATPEPSTVPQIIYVIVQAGSIVALNRFSSWLYKRFVNKKPDIATINNTNVVDNSVNITTIIHNHAQPAGDQKNSKKD